MIITFTLEGIGGQIKENWEEGDGTTSAVTIRIADFINNVVATRRLTDLLFVVSASSSATKLIENPPQNHANYFNFSLSLSQGSLRQKGKSFLQL